MRSIVFVLSALVLFSGCATAYKINSISLGMSKEDVFKTMGKPVSTSATEGTEYLNYSFSETSDDDFLGRYTPYYVCIREGKVVSYGRAGDFDSTKDPTQVIKVVGDVKSNETIDIRKENPEELSAKIKVLNKLLADGLITKSDFEGRKQKLLDTYVGQ